MKGVQAILRNLVSMRNFGRNKKLTISEAENIILQNISRNMQNFLESHCLVDDLVDFLNLSMFINTSA